ncbi:MAG TPA: TetR/AcrR family transcriptional regulator [Myxococcota bacterium]|nr:TetR/AcrR family transcriptional regulator [Myxococcota bacterium]
MRKPGRPRNPLPRRRLLAEAAALFAAKGYGASSMAEIASACGIRKSSLFHHVESKEALYVEVLKTTIDDLGALVVAAVAEPGDFLQRLDRLGAGVTDYLGTHPQAAALLLRELMDHGPYVDSVGVGAVRTTMQLTSAFLAAGMAEGAIAQQDPRQLAMSIAGVHLLWFATSEVSSLLLEGDVFTPEQVCARKIAVLAQVHRICGVAARSDPR